jgi:lipoprotein-anchoring transpeptidase ErfK/SrfK
MLPNWLKAVASGLIVAGAALLMQTPALAFDKHMPQPAWMPPPNVGEMDIDQGFGNDRNWSVPRSSWAEPTATAPRYHHHAARLDGAYARQVVPYPTSQPAGTVIVDTRANFLYLVLGHGEALRYGVGTARPGFGWHGTYQITNKREWPGWTPPAAMLVRQPGIPHHMTGGIDNPLGARALYIGRTLYRIHGTNQPWTIGTDISSGCIRMTNADVIDLYARVKIGAKVVVL